MKLVFVYAGHPSNGSNSSPYTITRELYRYLRARVDVMYYDWCTMGCPPVDRDDVIIGHPNYDPNTVVQQLFAKARCRAKCLIFPLHHGIPEHNLPFTNLVHQADEVFNIMGPYWYDTLPGSQFESWQPKITRLDMAVDASKYPFLRTKFNPPGRRNLVYVGHARPEKNVEMLYEVMRRLPDVGLTWYGGGYQPLQDLPNVTTVGWSDLTPEVAARIVRDGDFFINCSQSDANPTTLLEAAAWGLIPVCTKQSGYHNSDVFVNIPLNDVDGTLSVLAGLQCESEESLLSRARVNRSRIESDHNWDRFGETVWNKLRKYT